MAMCAGVQNVSRPIDRCQEISQCTPTMANVTAATEHHTYHGTASVLVVGIACVVAVAAGVIHPSRTTLVYTRGARPSGRTGLRRPNVFRLDAPFNLSG